MPDIKDYYEILGLTVGSSSEEVKQAYRDLIKVWHPDRFAHDPRVQKMAEGKSKQINLAYEEISLFINAKSRANSNEQTTPPRSDSNSQTDSSKGNYNSDAANTNIPRFIVSDLTVLDKKLNIRWTKDAHIVGSLSWTRANEFIYKLNNEKYAGYDNWRLPTVSELSSLSSCEAFKITKELIEAYCNATFETHIKYIGGQKIRVREWGMPTAEWLHSSQAAKLMPTIDLLNSKETLESWLSRKTGFFNIQIKSGVYWSSENGMLEATCYNTYYLWTQSAFKKIAKCSVWPVCGNN